ncbi:hypothetical protein PR202_ga25859 [Eleusine coracana subsp. coracana]|uniref:E3 UFM1-protein ligase 1 homolog n=1 Tax=Eleusine coracana subsp. coracana TaxID=191504 RepID=A0AAV5DAE7_ELECO|nr:hypothetical protein PR202_ga25859 [Eleusine coracana subsp. coracana]
MDAELLELQRQLEAAQSARSSVRLSERNVVELVQKLQERGIIDFELLHTVSGKEYITSDHLKHEIKMEINKRGRASLVDLSDTLGVDLYHVERQSQKVVSDDLTLMLINGEIMSQSYWDSVTEEINEKLQERSQIALAEIAAQLHIGSELVINILEPRLGTIVKGRLEGGQLYTPAYVSRITAMVRGAARGITVPTNLPSVWNSLQQQLQEMHGASGVSVEGSFFQSIFNGLLKEGAVLGSVRAGGQWTPANSYIGYDVLQKLVIPQPKQYLEARYPDGIALDAVFVHHSVVGMLDAAVGDAIESGHWIDSLSVLPSYISGPDATKILSLCQSLQRAVKSSKAVVFGESCVFSSVFIKNIFDRLEKEMDSFGIKYSVGQGKPMNVNVGSEQRTGSGSDTKDLGDNDASSTGVLSDRGSKKKRGKGAGSNKGGALLKDDDNDESIPVKGKKGSDDVNGPLKLLSSHLRPMLVNSWMKKRNTMLSGNAERRRRLLDNLQKQLDEDVLVMQLYEKGLDVFEDDPATSGILHKHLLRSNEEELLHLSTADRSALAKNLPGALSQKAQALVDALEGKAFNKALQAPGRAVGAVITLLKDKLPDSTYKVLADYHGTTVKLLALQAAATDEEDCASDRMLEKKEDLEERLMPELKSLVLGTSKE